MTTTFQLLPDVSVPTPPDGPYYAEVLAFQSADFTWVRLGEVALTSLRLRCPGRFNSQEDLALIPASRLKEYVSWLSEQVLSVTKAE